MRIRIGRCPNFRFIRTQLSSIICLLSYFILMLQVAATHNGSALENLFPEIFHRIPRAHSYYALASPFLLQFQHVLHLRNLRDRDEFVIRVGERVLPEDVAIQARKFHHAWFIFLFADSNCIELIPFHLLLKTKHVARGQLKRVLHSGLPFRDITMQRKAMLQSGTQESTGNRRIIARAEPTPLPVLAPHN